MEQDLQNMSEERTVSLCAHTVNGQRCLAPVRASVHSEGDNTYLIKKNADHGHPDEKVLLSDDPTYYTKVKSFRAENIARSDIPLTKEEFRTYVSDINGQHSCVSVLEVTDRCNLQCPTCFAASGPDHGSHLPLSEILETMQQVANLPDRPDVLQISGGEPTMHPDFFRIVQESKGKFKFTMVNTNGIRLATDADFAARLAEQREDFGIYLQFDSFKPNALRKIRGADLTKIREQAVERVNKYDISTILVSTLQKGTNTDEIGRLIDFGVQQKAVRGVNFQPTQAAGRSEQYNPLTERFTLSELRREIATQSSVFALDDLIPAPCNPDALFMGFALKYKGRAYAISGKVKPKILLEDAGLRRTVAFTQHPELEALAARLFKEQSFFDAARSFLGPLNIEDTFQVLGIRFSDAYDFDVRVVKRSCVHIAREGRVLPFDVQNIFYR
ncbi:radical SAM protein [Candidatus Pacearchaeota archaeon]|nr:radical SAM protein [Candidatus Pacearchaeota archaeon]